MELFAGKKLGFPTKFKKDAETERKLLQASMSAEEVLERLSAMLGAKDTDELIRDVEQLIAEEGNKDMVDMIFSDAIEKISRDYPDANPKELAANEDFMNSLFQGIDPIKAYKLTKVDELLAKNMQAQKKSEPNGDEQKRNSRIAEVGVTPSNSMQVNMDPSRMTMEELKKIKERVARGERVIL